MTALCNLASKVNSLLLRKSTLFEHFKRTFFVRTSNCLLHNHCESVSSVNFDSGSSGSLPTRGGKTLKDFIVNNNNNNMQPHYTVEDVPYLSENDSSGKGRKVYVEVYGCQMNTNDTEIVYSILKSSGYKIGKDAESSDVVLLMTCSIREGAEQKIWRRLDQLKELKKFKLKSFNSKLKIGILGCMAERLKTSIMEKEKEVDLICGPDSYRSLPRLLSLTAEGHAAANVLLSLDETYADIQPIRRNPGSPSAFVSIMRGCDNMCTYCVVPFTRGRERNRPLDSILEEVERLSDQGVKDITLLGQNVNSYRDTSAPATFHSLASDLREGFTTVYKRKPIQSGCYNFVDLLDRASLVNPEMRIRFTSPHPKDFPTEVLELISSRRNISRQLHVPAQSGSNRVLERMGRGYTVETYLDLIEEIRNILPGVSLSSDFIAGFCEETDDDHEMTLNLMEKVKYNVAYCFPYSMREKTRAYRRLDDNVPKEVKVKRTEQLVEVFRRNADLINKNLIGSEQLVLVEGTSKRSEDDLYGRNDGNTKVIFSKNSTTGSGDDVTSHQLSRDCKEPISVGDYIVVEVTSSSSQVLKGIVKRKTTLSSYYNGQFYC